MIQNVELNGRLEVPKGAEGLVVFTHEIGSGRFSERNQEVATGLNDLGIGTLQFDLLTQEEEAVIKNRFDIETLTERLIAVTKWCMENEKTKKLRLGYFGEGLGAAAALSAAAYWGTKIKAVVCRGGRPDLAIEVLDLIETPTLLIVGGEDKEEIELNRPAYQKIGAIKKLEIVPGATHTFEESGAMARVIELAGLWMVKYL